MAKSISWCASAPIVAPTSSTTLSPRRVGQIAAIAGRSIVAMVRRQNFAIAISAPVLPADTQTSASPFLTASIAFHIDDFQRPWRSAWLGLSSIRTAISQWENSLASAELRQPGKDRPHDLLLPEDEEADIGAPRQRPSSRPAGPRSGRDRRPWRQWKSGSRGKHLTAAPARGVGGSLAKIAVLCRAAQLEIGSLDAIPRG